MSVDVLQEMARNFYITAGIFFCVVFILFFRFQIWKLLGDLSGIRKRREMQAISSLGHVQENSSQGVFELRYLQEERTESFEYTEDTGLLEPKSVQGTYCVIEKMEYIGSETWIE